MYAYKWIYKPLMHIAGCGECCRYYQFTASLETGFCYDIWQFTVRDLLCVLHHTYAYSEWGFFTTVTHMHNNIIINMQTYTVIWDHCIWVCCTNLHQCKTVIQLIIFNSTCWKCKGNFYSQMCVYLTGHCDIIISYYVQVALDTLLMSGRNIMFGEGT